MEYNNSQIPQNPNIPNYIVPANKTNKTLIFIIIILLLIIVGGGGLLLAKYVYFPKPKSDLASQQPITNSSTGSFSSLNTEETSTPPATVDETANWKTYTNTKHNYSIKYPLDFSLVKGPGANLPDGEFQKLDNISFSGMQKSGDLNAGVVFGITANPQNANGKPIQCATNDECLRKWMEVLNKTVDQVSYINKTIMGKNVNGFEYQNKNDLYTQINQYFVYLEGNSVWQISLTMNNYTVAEVRDTFDQILSTFKFLP